MSNVYHSNKLVLQGLTLEKFVTEVTDQSKQDVEIPFD